MFVFIYVIHNDDLINTSLYRIFFFYVSYNTYIIQTTYYMCKYFIFTHILLNLIDLIKVTLTSAYS